MENQSRITTIPDEVVELFEDHYAKITRNPLTKYKSQWCIIVIKANAYTYNELKAAIKQQNNTASEEDTIHI